MKHKLLLNILPVLFFCGIVSAQKTKTLYWDNYKMKFEIYDNMTTMESNGDKFWAKNELMNFIIFPRKSKQLDYIAMKTELMNWANESGVLYSAKNRDGYTQPNYIANINGYWGYMIEGKQKSMNAAMLLLTDPNNKDLIFFVWVAYSDGGYNDANKILKGIQPM